jgi:N-acetyl-anhydromuramyl-L-alanine amidase AmpD
MSIEPQPLAIAPRIIAVKRLPPVKWRPAHPHNFSTAKRIEVQCVVLHCTDGHEGFTKDDDCAAMFADANLKPARSAGYVVDADSVCQCVADMQIAYHCGHTGNQRGIGIELCGLANQTDAQWHDDVSLKTLGIAAKLVADLCRRYTLPVHFVNAAGLRAGASGITTHAEVSAAWHESNHSDPGIGFPILEFIAAVVTATFAAPSTPPPPPTTTPKTFV